MLRLDFYHLYIGLGALCTLHKLIYTSIICWLKKKYCSQLGLNVYLFIHTAALECCFVDEISNTCVGLALRKFHFYQTSSSDVNGSILTKYFNC